MMTFRAIRNAAMVALLGLVPMTALEAQSLTAIRGLGYPVLATDARAEVLGGLGVGLQGLTSPLANPAAAAGVARRGAVVSVAALEQTASLGDASESTGATRFPLIQVLYPVRGIVLTVSYGSYLDQSWGVDRSGEQFTGSTTIGFRDLIQSTGGIGQLQLGAAVPISSRLAVGAAVGAHTGEQRLQIQRVFPDSVALGPLQSFTETRRGQHFAPLAQVGVRWDPVDILRVAASFTWAGTLETEFFWDELRQDGVPPRPNTTVEYDLPMQVAGGASAYLAPSLLATVSGRWSGWSSVGDVAGTGFETDISSSGHDTWEVGGGLEWDDADVRDTRTYPLRLGAQYRELPFSIGGETPREWFVGAGLGMRLGATADNPLVRADLTVQRGERTSPTGATVSGGNTALELTESAWRFSLTLSVFGN